MTREDGRRIGQKTKILVIDDEPFVAKTVSQTLRAGGYEVEACLEWPHVARAVRRLRPRLILVEAGVAGVTPEELVEDLRRLGGEAASVAIAFYSSEPAEHLERLACDCRTAGYICKSTPSDGVLQRVAELIATR